MTTATKFGLGILVAGSSLVIATVSGGGQLVGQAQLPPTQSTTPVASITAPVVTQLLKLAAVSSRDVVYGLGLGDSQLLIQAVQAFEAKRAVGIETNPDMVNLNQENARKAGVSDRVEFRQQDLLQTDIRDATVVILPPAPDTNLKLRPKLLSDLRPGTRIVAPTSTLGDWKPDKVVSVSTTPKQTLNHWIVPANIAGDWQGSLEYAPGRRQPYTLRFSQQYQSVKGDAIVEGEKYKIPEIKLTGEELTFSRSENIQGQDVKVVFNGRIVGNTLKGIADLDAGPFSRKFPIIARRSKS